MLKATTSNNINELIDFFNTKVVNRANFVGIYFDASSGLHVLIYWG